MEVYWLVPVVLVSGIVAAALRYRYLAARGRLWGRATLFAGLVCAALAFVLCLFASWIAAGVGLSLVLLVAVIIGTLFASALIVSGAMIGSFGLVLISSLMLILSAGFLLSDGVEPSAYNTKDTQISSQGR